MLREPAWKRAQPHDDDLSQIYIVNPSRTLSEDHGPRVPRPENSCIVGVDGRGRPGSDLSWVSADVDPRVRRRGRIRVGLGLGLGPDNGRRWRKRPKSKFQTDRNRPLIGIS